MAQVGGAPFIPTHNGKLWAIEYSRSDKGVPFQTMPDYLHIADFFNGTWNSFKCLRSLDYSETFGDLILWGKGSTLFL